MSSRKTEQWLYDNEFEMVLFQIQRLLKIEDKKGKSTPRSIYREIERESLHTHTKRKESKNEKSKNAVNH